MNGKYAIGYPQHGFNGEGKRRSEIAVDMDATD